MKNLKIIPSFPPTAGLRSLLLTDKPYEGFLAQRQSKSDLALSELPEGIQMHLAALWCLIFGSDARRSLRIECRQPTSVNDVSPMYGEGFESKLAF